MFKVKAIFALILGGLLFFLSTNVQSGELKPVNNYVNLPGSPIKILSYESEYERETKYSSEGIYHKIELQNISNKEIVAYRILFVSFNVFNEFITKLGGVSLSSIKPNETDKGSWKSHRYGDFAFHTGIAFVETVRFIDGSIWQADESLIMSELKKITKEFDASLLKEEPGK